MFYMIDNASLKSKNIEKKKCLPLVAKAIDLLCYRNLELCHEKNPFLFLYIEYKNMDIYPTHLIILYLIIL